MKKYWSSSKRVWFLFTLMVLPMVFVGCSNDDSDSGSKQNYNIIKQEGRVQSMFSDTLSAMDYDLASNRFVVNDVNTLQNQAINHFNNAQQSTEQKLYLAEMMLYQMQYNGLEFDVSAIVNAIDDRATKILVRDVYLDKGVSFLQAEAHESSNGVIVGSDDNELLETGNGDHRIALGKGDDKVTGGSGSQVYYFNKGDGLDVIFDQGGLDKLALSGGIVRDDVIVKLQKNADLIIGLKQDGVAFEVLTDKVTIVDWMRPNNRIEVIQFSDGRTLKLQDVFEQFNATDQVEVVQLSAGNDIFDAKGGNDVIKAGGGNDTLTGGSGNDRLEGGLGNDTYVFSRGDGQDTIIDAAGHDTLQFAGGIFSADLIAQYVGADLLIGLKEEGKSFDALSDVITLKNYMSRATTIEAIYLQGYVRVDVQALLNQATEADDTLIFAADDDVIDALAGEGDDFIVGGLGDDSLEGGAGDDTYLFNRGDGKDVVFDDANFGYQNSQKIDAGNDTLRFGEGITAEDIEVQI